MLRHTVREDNTESKKQVIRLREARAPNETVAPRSRQISVYMQAGYGRAIKRWQQGHRTRHKGTPSQREEDPTEGQEREISAPYY